jgi:replication-associated recombination protein RarA
MNDQPNNDFFIETNSYRALIEMSDACRQTRSMGLSFGKPGAGKTMAAQHISNWPIVEKNFTAKNGTPIEPEKLRTCDTILYLPSVTVSAPRLRLELTQLRSRFEATVTEGIGWHNPKEWAEAIQSKRSTLVIVDEAFRLKYQALEELRDLQNEWNIGILLLCDPGFQQSLARMWHFCIRVPYVEEFKVFSQDEVNQYIDKKAELMKLPKPADEVYALIFWYSQGNPRSLRNMFMMIDRILKINDDIVKELTGDVVETAREMMMYGLSGKLAKSAT